MKRLALLSCLCLAFAQGASAQDFPVKPIRIIAPIAPGAVPDLVPRMLAPGMSKFLGQPVVVENKPGAGGLVGYEYVARQSAPDGYTIGLANQPLATVHVFFKDPRFDPQKDLRPVTLLMDGAIMIASRADAPWKNIQELAAHAKANPGKLNYGSAGVQTSGALLMEAIKQRFGLDIVNIPFQGGTAQSRPALLGGSIELSVYTEGLAVADAGKVRVMAITGGRRLASLPDAPTVKELGLPEIPNTWFAFVAPGGTPSPVIDRLYAASRAAMQAPEVVEWMSKSRFYPVVAAPDETAKRLSAEMAVWSDIAQRAGIKPQ